jgi:NADPH:quinone reductase-like Zn-dependent oxidoreductase
MRAQTTLKAQATMKAVVFHRYGPPEQLELEDIEKPAVTDGLVVLNDLIEAGKVTPVVDRTYPLSETAAAIRYLEGHHPRAKVVITM